MKQIIEIQEDTKIGEVILEKGDRIQILKEVLSIRNENKLDQLMELYGFEYEEVLTEVINKVPDNIMSKILDDMLNELI